MQKSKKLKRSIFRKTAVIFVLVALAPVTILGLRGQTFYADQLNSLVDQGAVSRDEADFQQKTLREQSFIYMGYGVVIALVLGYFFASSLVRPIRKLEQGASLIGDGQLDHRVETDTDDELEDLASTINRMASSLQAREDEISKRNNELSLLYDVAHNVSESRELKELLTYALERSTQITGSQMGCVLIRDEGEELYPLYCVGQGAAMEENEAVAELFRMAANKSVTEGQPSLFMESNVFDLLGFEAVACVPMRFEGHLQGAICIAGESGDFSHETLELLSAIANEVAVAIENARLFMQLESQNLELSLAAAEITNLFAQAERNKSFGTRYDNSNLARCWEIKECDKTECPAFGLELNLRCWQVAGTHCGGEVQGVFAQKLGRCEKCTVYKTACPDRITVLGETFNNMMAILEQRVKEHEELQLQLYSSAKLAAIGELAAGVAHEINNPLTGILGNAMLMKADAGADSDLLKKISVIESEALRARDIVRNLLDFAHQGKSLDRQHVSIRELIEQTLFLLRHQANLSSVQIAVDMDDALPEIAIEPNQIKQVFMNIIHNALQAMNTGGRLHIAAKVNKNGNGEELHIVFRDTGVGMDADSMTRIFDPFYTTKGVGEGTGLGLSVSQRIVDEHGGRMLVQSKLNQGSTFTVVLPLSQADSGTSRRVA